MTEKFIWTHNEVDVLINAYREREVLWNTKIDDFKDRIKRDDAIKELSEICSCSVEEIKKKIRNLRTQYSCERNKRMVSKSGSGASSMSCSSKWQYYDAMDFLSDSLTSRPTKSNLTMLVS